MEALSGAILAAPKVEAALLSPKVPKAAKVRLLTGAVAGAPGEFVHFLAAVVKRGRQALLPAIAKAFHELNDVRLNRVRAGVILAREPDEQLKEQMRHGRELQAMVEHRDHRLTELELAERVLRDEFAQVTTDRDRVLAQVAAQERIITYRESFRWWLTLPWLAVYRVTWERPVASAAPPESLRDALRVVRRHGSYQRLLSIYITGRIVLDVVSAVFFYYVAWVVGRRDDFELIMLTFLVTVIAALPIWLRLSQRFDKHSVLVAGMLWWAAAQLVLAFVGGDLPRAAVFVMAAIADLDTSASHATMTMESAMQELKALAARAPALSVERPLG